MNIPLPPASPPDAWVEAALLPPARVVAALDATVAAFEAATAFACEAGRRQDTGAYAVLHRLCYREVRRRFDLSANLTVRAIACAARRLKGEAPARLPTVEYDRRVFSLSREAREVSLSAVGGRVRGVPWAAAAADRYRCMHLRPDAARLVRGRDGTYRLGVHLGAPSPHMPVPARPRA